jgi:HEAT repeat protein
MASADLDVVRLAAAQKVGFTACRSKLAEVLEKTMKAELIRLGWNLE